MLNEDMKRYFIGRLEEVSYSKVVDESVILVEEGAGTIYFEKYCLWCKCFFVVAQMHDGNCWAVMYLGGNDELEIVSIMEKIKKRKYVVRQLIGHDSETGHEIVVNPSGGWFHHFQKTPNHHVEFYFHVKDYSTNHTSQQNIYYLANLSVKLDEKVGFIVDNVEIASIDFMKEFYPTNRLNLSRLIIHNEHVPNGWDNHQVAHTIRILLGLALGRMIVENHWWDNQGKYWFSTPIENNHFTSFTEANGDFDIAGFSGGISQDMHAIQFVESVLSVILRKNFEDYSFYINKIWDYIYYASSAREQKQRAILLCSVVETILPKLIHQNPEDIKLKENLSKLFLKYNWQTKPPHHNNRKQDKINLIAFWQKSIEGIYNELTSIDCHIELFVWSRNKLFHEHRFACELAFEDSNNKDNDDQKKKKCDLEAQNIQLFVPLLFATILGYKGDYWDSIQNKFMQMPR